jgi:hypothetical protein
MKENKINSAFRKGLWFVTLIFLLHPSCTDKFEEYNTDKTKLMSVGPKELSGLLSYSLIEGSNWWNINDYNRITRTITNHLSGYMCITDITYEQNQINRGYHVDAFNDIFVKALPALQNIFDMTKDNGEFQDEYAISLIWKVFLMHHATDFWGPIPYTDGGTGKTTIAYQSQKDVYYLMFDDLKTAIHILTATVASDASANTYYGVGDMIFNGSVISWLKFANSLRLRLAMRISNVDAAKAQMEAEAAADGITMDSSSDDAFLDVSKWNTLGNGLARVNPWYTSLMSASMESFLKGYEDPRMEKYFSPVVSNDYNTDPQIPAELRANVGGFHGMANGFATAIESNYRYCYSCLNTSRWDGATIMTEPIPMMYAAETYFLKAEGALKGWDMGNGTAQSFYEKGIAVSMEQWGVSSNEAQSYINSNNLPVAPNDYLYDHAAITDIPVKFSSSQEKQYEQIITQKWLANFPISAEAFADYRRTRLPKIYPKAFSANAYIDLNKGMIITRLPFTEQEYNTQPEEVAKAIKLLGEGAEDLENVPLWWDVHPNGN